MPPRPFAQNTLAANAAATIPRACFTFIAGSLVLPIGAAIPSQVRDAMIAVLAGNSRNICGACS